MRETLVLSVVLSLSLPFACYGLEPEEIARVTAPANTSVGDVVPPEDPNPPDIRPRDVWDLGVELSGIVTSKHMWHGFDLLDDHAAFIPIASFSLGDTGLAARIIGVYPLADDLEKCQELNGNASYTRTFFGDTPHLTSITLDYFYYGKPRRPSREANAQEMGLAFSWPAILPIGNGSLVPSYYVAGLWPARSHADNSDCGGFMHVFGLAYNFVVPNWHWGPLVPHFGLFSDVTYNDGLGGPWVDHDWSHATFGASTSIQHRNLTCTLSLNHQVSMDKSVDNEDETWCGLNVTYRF